MAQGTSTQTNQNSGSGGGAFRDVNASLGAFDFGSSSATSTSGDISIGSVNSGQTVETKLGLVKTIMLFGALILVIKELKRGK